MSTTNYLQPSSHTRKNVKSRLHFFDWYVLTTDFDFLFFFYPPRHGCLWKSNRPECKPSFTLAAQPWMGAPTCMCQQEALERILLSMAPPASPFLSPSGFLLSSHEALLHLSWSGEFGLFTSKDKLLSDKWWCLINDPRQNDLSGKRRESFFFHFQTRQQQLELDLFLNRWRGQHMTIYHPEQCVCIHFVKWTSYFKSLN